MIDFEPDLESAAVNWRRKSPLDCEGLPPYSVAPATFDPEAEILRVPLLTPLSCRRLIDKAESCGVAFRASKSDGRFAASELLLREISSSAERDLLVGLTHLVSPLVWRVWRLWPSIFSPPFIIKYQSGHATGLPLHHDFQSDVSFSVALNDAFSGGGMCFPRQGKRYEHRTVGSALLFPGKVTHLHAAADIRSGIRYVLTIWSKHALEVHA